MTYDYICEACGHGWEAQQSISAAPLKDCPHCGEPKAKRQISLGGGFILKGGGWYSDLYSSSSGAAKNAPSEGAASSDSAGTETKAAKSSAPEGKSEAQAEPKAPKAEASKSPAPAATSKSPKAD